MDGLFRLCVNILSKEEKGLILFSNIFLTPIKMWRLFVKFFLEIHFLLAKVSKFLIKSRQIKLNHFCLPYQISAIWNNIVKFLWWSPKVINQGSNATYKGHCRPDLAVDLSDCCTKLVLHVTGCCWFLVHTCEREVHSSMYLISKVKNVCCLLAPFLTMLFWSLYYLYALSMFAVKFTFSCSKLLLTFVYLYHS